MPENWDSKRKISQKDTDARWTKKRNVVHYGYKDHIKIDNESKIIMNYTITTANIHDSVEIANLVNENQKRDAGQKILNLKIKMGFFSNWMSIFCCNYEYR